MIVTKRMASKPSMQIRKPLPSISTKPEGVKSKWFRDPNTFYWIQLECPTGTFKPILSISNVTLINLMFFRRNLGKIYGIQQKNYF